MMPQRNGSLHLFTLFGISVYIHWTWFVVAYFFYTSPTVFGSGLYFVVTYGALFGIVLLHEFGHALACRSVGGVARQIVLWPLGGVAYVNPPQRPGAVLWSIVAGPLVNVVLVPVTIGAWLIAESAGAAPAMSHSLGTIAGINLTLLIFNMLPIYPLDGGQTLWAILWFFMGRARGLKVASTIGLIVAGVGALALLISGSVGNQPMLFVIALFVGWQAWQGRRAADLMLQAETGSWDKVQEQARRMANTPPESPRKFAPRDRP